MTSPPVSGVVVAHEDLARALVQAVEHISGVRDALQPVSNESCTPDELERRVESTAGPGPAIVFVDMASGSCAFAGRRVARRSGKIAVISGVSLPMLLDFVFHREMALPELAERLVHKARSDTVVHVSPESTGGDGPGGRTETDRGAPALEDG